MPLLRRRIRCHSCNQPSRDAVAQTPRSYRCPQCDAVSYFDERGLIADPPAEDTATPALHYATAMPRSSSPVQPPEPDALFCRACQRNQLLLTKTLAEYLPDEDDPEYAAFAQSLDAYRSELEDRYPQVCADCLPRVQDQIRAAGYAAKADNLRRIIDRSREHSRTVHTTRQAWTLRLIALARCLYLASAGVGLLWHLRALAVDGHVADALVDSSWRPCLVDAVSARVHPSCVTSPAAWQLLQASLLADAATVWWNPRLASKTNSITGRMRGLKSLWAIRLLVLTLRTACFVYWTLTPLRPANLAVFYYTNLALLAAIVLSLTLTWKTVRIVYTPVALPEDTYIPSAPNTPQRPRSSYKPAHPHISTFDTMAQGFTSSFQADAASALPPSPTLTESSTTSHYTEFTTPARASVHQDDSMDWTPTTRRFAAAAPAILPPQFSRSPAPASPALARRDPVSLFAKKDPNPFRHKIPPAPKPPAHARADPWKRAPWQPTPRHAVTPFFRSERTTRNGYVYADADGGLEADGKGLQGLGVPRTVRRDAELFASPKLKYDYYGTMRDTGLEDTFNGLFSG
ncbi:Ima1 N-terminal domain-containing protein [Boeremia exigua]|uniref:Ima1 N-terminal domain-containing protein n=1 Tax=Boeremia exigua TaxID=749465 RepID=UPI001E8DC048|nr:Ima1 N-terminal domain-containing protein [Boeremia exigua]KAH6639520.1 Ima1 N-terminal domain-containing protein [Boeremia exigua]